MRTKIRKLEPIDTMALNLEGKDKEAITQLLLEQLIDNDARITYIKNNLGPVKLPYDLLDTTEELILKMKKKMNLENRIITGYDQYPYKMSKSVIYWNAIGIIYYFKGQYDISIEAFKQALTYSNVYENAIVNLCLVVNHKVHHYKKTTTFLKKVV